MHCYKLGLFTACYANECTESSMLKLFIFPHKAFFLPASVHVSLLQRSLSAGRVHLFTTNKLLRNTSEANEKNETTDRFRSTLTVFGRYKEGIGLSVFKTNMFYEMQQCRKFTMGS